ncbi:MAG: hypothetical protein IKL83_01810 [Muribaculaceae bacterium]|nr:hypothetical protein [Muribaculaceae bacterium]
MKKLISYLSMALFVVLASCSGGDKEEEKFNAAETQALITQYDANGGTLTSEEYSVLIKNTHLLFADIKQQMKELLDIADKKQFMQKYESLKQDKQFIEELTIREQVWRVLILGQKGFSEENKIEFGNLPEECQLIDYYDDCIIARVDENTDSSAN